MIRTALCFFFLLPLLSIQAQEPVLLLRDPSADWVAYIELALPADPMNNPWAEDSIALPELLHFKSDATGFLTPVTHSISAKLWEAAREGEWELFEDEGLMKPISFEQAIKKCMTPDTVVSFHPDTYEEHFDITLKEDLPGEASLLRVRQLLVYRNTSAVFEIHTLAVAPCREDGAPFYWMKVPDDTSWPDGDIQNLPGIHWAVRYTTWRTSPGNDSWEEIKNTTGPILTRFTDRMRADTTVQLYTPGGDLVPDDERACLFSCTRQINVYDPERDREMQEEIIMGLDHEEVTELQLIEEWAWNDLESRLLVRLVAVAPRFWTAPSFGTPAQPAILFYRKCLLDEP